MVAHIRYLGATSLNVAIEDKFKLSMVLSFYLVNL